MRIVLALATLTLGGCYSSAHAARESFTTIEHGFVCYSAPVVECPNRADRRCTGDDQRWLARCPDTNRQFVCVWSTGLFRDSSIRCAPLDE